MKYVTSILMASLVLGCGQPPKVGSSSGGGSSQSQVATCDVNGAPFGGGTGSASEPWLICTVTQLKNLNWPYNADSAKLTQNLDLSGEANWKVLDQFFGVFDGQDYTLSNLTATQAAPNVGSPLGLFRDLSGTVKNLKFSNVNLNGSESGAIAGTSTISTSIALNIKVLSGLIQGNSEVGGIIGENAGRIENCTSSATITVLAGVGHKQGGGLTGYNTSTALVKDSNANGVVSGPSEIGRIIGRNAGGAQNCFVAGFPSTGQQTIGVNTGSLSACP